jgi:hypothetical protein
MSYNAKRYGGLTSRFYDKQMDLELVHEAHRPVLPG